MPRVVQFSTQSARSIPDARLALDTPRLLDPIITELAAVGVHVRPGQTGHVWGFSPNTLIARGDEAIEAGDIAVRIEPGMLTSRIYEVLAFMPNRGELAEQVNGQPWRGGADPYPNFVVFKPFASFPARSYRDLVDQLRYDDYVTGPRYEARFIPVDADDLAAVITQAIPLPAAPRDVAIPLAPRDRRRRWSNVRQGGTIFRQQVFAAQRNSAGRLECAACNIDDERVLEAAHIIDYGLVEDEWWNGLPMCRNHHRLFDLQVLTLRPDGQWESQDSLSGLRVAKADISLLPRAPADPAIEWRYGQGSA